MATKKKEVSVEETTQQEIKRFKGSQILKLPEFNSRVARIVIKPNALYSIEEVNVAIEKYMKKKG